MCMNVCRLVQRPPPTLFQHPPLSPLITSVARTDDGARDLIRHVFAEPTTGLLVYCMAVVYCEYLGYLAVISYGDLRYIEHYVTKIIIFTILEFST